jgi:TRAP-type C4-dicarboxylate transport system permease large subunit
VVPGLILTAMVMAHIAVHASVRRNMAPAERGFTAVSELLGAIRIRHRHLGDWGDLSWATFVAAVRRTIRVLGNILFIIYTAHVPEVLRVR